jgi:type II secretory pathway pseudopilin PulG
MASSPTEYLFKGFSRGGFSAVESVFAMVLVAGLLVVALDTVGASSVAQRSLEQRTTARMLASELMAEIMAQDYEETEEAPTFGIEPSEAGGTRAKFDDSDDYAGWSESPPQSKEGVERLEYSDWQRVVSVHRIDPSNYQNMAFLDTGLRKITVNVLFKGDKWATLTALRWGKSNAAIASDPPELEQ